ncbi:MAG TPA: hypothetical protein VFM55_14225 [Micromonosporaceae bacterium]|nr:hypothetical protein [Micromonosporaceae bacterium]
MGSQAPSPPGKYLTWLSLLAAVVFSACLGSIQAIVVNTASNGRFSGTEALVYSTLAGAGALILTALATAILESHRRRWRGDGGGTPEAAWGADVAALAIPQDPSNETASQESGRKGPRASGDESVASHQRAESNLCEFAAVRLKLRFKVFALIGSLVWIVAFVVWLAIATSSDDWSSDSADAIFSCQIPAIFLGLWIGAGCAYSLIQASLGLPRLRISPRDIEYWENPFRESAAWPWIYMEQVHLRSGEIVADIAQESPLAKPMARHYKSRLSGYLICTTEELTGDPSEIDDCLRRFGQDRYRGRSGE